MVAAHNEDLQAAQKQGMRTCFVHRPTEDAEVTGGCEVRGASRTVVSDDHLQAGDRVRLQAETGQDEIELVLRLVVRNHDADRRRCLWPSAVQ